MKSFELTTVLDDIRPLVIGSPLVGKVGVFGSLARGDYTQESDIDLLIEYVQLPVFSLDHVEKFCALCNEVSDLLSRKYDCEVDIVQFTRNPLDVLDDEKVLREVVWL